MATGKISAVLCYNRPDLMYSVIDQMGHDLAVVDNGSTPELQHADQQMWIRWEQNRFWTGGWNRTMKLLNELEYEWVWMLNSDVTGINQVMADHLWRLAITSPDCIAISPTFNSPHNHMHRWQTHTVREVAWLDMPAVFMNVQKFLELGGFDEEFVGYGSDMDFCRRAQGTGKFYVADHLGFQHGGGETAVSEGITQHTDIQHMNAVLSKKWGVSNWTEMFPG